MPSTNEFDVVVIGGGPAGSAAALTARNAGLNVCIIDKSRFPRDKLCGGLFTGRSRSIMSTVYSVDISDGPFITCSNVSFYMNGRYLCKQDGYSDLYFCYRYELDAFLLNYARLSGVIVTEGYSVVEFDFKSEELGLSDGRRIRYQTLIAADGVNSQTAKALFGRPYDPMKIGFGLEVEVPRELLHGAADRVEIEFGAARWGYGWTFPKKKSVTLGVGGIHSLNKDLKKRMDRYLISKNLVPDQFRYKGQYLPFGEFHEVPGKENVLLCGDAAGLVDPITGEGIAYAMESGSAAGVAVARALQVDAPRRSLEFYQEQYSAISSNIRKARFWRNFILPEFIQRGFSWAFSDASTLQKGYLDILAGKRNYDDLYGIFLTQISKGITKPFRYLFGMLR